MSENALSRWARRKREVRLAERAEERAATGTAERAAPEPAEPSEGADAPAEASGPETDALADAIARLPSLDQLTPDTDLAPFLRAGIPGVLRNAALRRMWSLDPGIRDFVSEAREYAYDWNTPGGVPGLGPMLPTDDIKAMVSRVFSGHAPDRAVAHRPEPEPEIEPADAAADPGEADAASYPREADAASYPREADASGMPAPAAACETIEQAWDRAPEPVASVPAAPMLPRLRRHGGAMPS